ncbi:MAG: hypothetical protein HY829_05510, partial [Actinobacteria bacterium]|nr:hypothetical protein [Actinomycetota bacterium]
MADLVAVPGVINLGRLPAGGYALELASGTATHRSAVEVTPHAGASMRYGFVASYPPGRNPDGLARIARRLHLTDIQFYDWAYRHADLLGGGEEYADPLGQTISLQTVRTLIGALHDVGSRALGYAAVYGVGAEEWPRWSDLALVRADGSPEELGGFLQLVDPGESRWQSHFTEDLRASTTLGFDGFHLDQYGYPRMGYGHAGVVDLAESFARIIAASREALPTSRLVFNNVNDFPTRRTAGTPQDAIYVEVWQPNLEYRDLADIITRARAADPAKPIVLAAYQSVYSSAPRAAADDATRFSLATVLSL